MTAANSKITPDMIRAWRSIPLKLVAQAASACVRGTSYTGCSKAVIYQDVAAPGTRKSNPKLFIQIMNELLWVRRAQEEKNRTQLQQAITRVTSAKKTIDASELATIRMVAGKEKTVRKVINLGVVSQWVGIGWVPERDATPADLETLPVVVRNQP